MRFVTSSSTAAPAGCLTAEYDHHWQYGHRHCLRTVEDVRAAPDDALLEALGLPNVERWGWLHFMIRDLSWFSLLANNWGLPSILTEYGGGGDVFAAEDERRAEAALHFLNLMREFGIDPVAQLDKGLDSVRSRYARMFKRPLEEEELRPWLRRRNEFCYFVHACRDFKFRPGVRSEYSEVKYTGAHRVEFLAQVRAAAANRRRSRNAPHPTDCAERQKVVELEEGLDAERRRIEERLNDQHRARWGPLGVAQVAFFRSLANLLNTHTSARLSSTGITVIVYVNAAVEPGLPCEKIDADFIDRRVVERRVWVAVSE